MTLALSRDTARLDLQAVGLVQPEHVPLFACTDPLAAYEAGE